MSPAAALVQCSLTCRGKPSCCCLSGDAFEGRIKQKLGRSDVERAPCRSEIVGNSGFAREACIALYLVAELADFDTVDSCPEPFGCDAASLKNDEPALPITAATAARMTGLAPDTKGQCQASECISSKTLINFCGTELMVELCVSSRLNRYALKSANSCGE